MIAVKITVRVIFLTGATGNFICIDTTSLLQNTTTLLKGTTAHLPITLLPHQVTNILILDTATLLLNVTTSLQDTKTLPSR